MCTPSGSVVVRGLEVAEIASREDLDDRTGVFVFESGEGTEAVEAEGGDGADGAGTGDGEGEGEEGSEGVGGMHSRVMKKGLS